MKRIIFSLGLTFLFVTIYSQPLKTMTVKSPAQIRTKEVFQVLKDNSSVKHGKYKKYKYKKLIETGYYNNNKKDSVWHIYYPLTGQLVASGKYKADTLVGIWTYYSFLGSVAQKYDHDHDSLVYYDQNERKNAYQTELTQLDTAQEKMPIFIGGTYYMHALIGNNMIYPKEAWLKLSTATVYISFVVDTNGNTTEVKSIRHTGDGFDEEAIRLVESLGRSWIPGVQKGKKVKVIFTLPLNFKIQ